MKLFTVLFLLLITMTAHVLADWTQTAGPEGGNISCFTSHNGFIYAGTNGAGIFRSSDNGATWTPANFGFGYPYATALLSKGSTLLASTVNVFRSTDDGATWTGGTGLPTGNSITSLVTDGTFVYGGLTSTSGSARVYRSSDDGATWEQFSTGSASFAGVISMCIDGSNIFAGVSGDGIYKSTNQGETWSPASAGLPGFSYPNHIITHGGMLFTGLSGNSVYRSTNNGTSWSVSGSGFPAGTEGGPFLSTGTNLIAASRTSSGQTQLFQSTDNGSTWSPFAPGLPPVQTLNVMAMFGSSIFIGSLGRGILRSNDNGSTWSQSHDGIINTWVRTVAASSSGVFAGTADDGMHRSVDAGTTWAQKTNGIPAHLKVRSVVSKGSSMFTVGQLGDSVRVYKSTNNGDTWAHSSTLPGFVFPSQVTHRTAVAHGNDLLVTTGNNIVWRSTDDGGTWTPSTGIPFDQLNGLASTGTHVYAAGISGAYRSTDGGTTWTLASTGIPPFPNLQAIAGSGVDVFAVTAYTASVYKSTNGGDTWATAAPLPGPTGTDVMMIGSTVFAGIGNGGVAMSTNSGTSWTLIRTGLPLLGIVYHILANDATYLYCGTDVRGVWKRPLSELVAVREVEGSAPESFVLNQNYPNPFNPSTMISFSVTEQSDVTLSVYDLLGREVAMLVRERLQAGSYEVEFNPQNLSSGTYLYKLSAGIFSETKKLQLLK